MTAYEYCQMKDKQREQRHLAIALALCISVLLGIVMHY